MQSSAGERLATIAESFARRAGRPLVEPTPGGLERALWEAPRAIVAHGTEPEPRFFYGNRVALDLFAMTAQAFIGLPSHRSAEPALREARARMLAGLEESGIVEDYSGVRIAANGRRFAIAGATVWNLVDERGHRQGQAATFSDWRFL
jgi:nicotinamide mononucleotide adenylyltransferase